MQRIKGALRRLARRAGLERRPPAAADQIARLAWELDRTRDDELTCDQVLHLLDQYAERVQRKEDAAAMMPLVQHHMELCSDCREEFEALMRILEAMPA